jgi:hypothetical protein
MLPPNFVIVKTFKVRAAFNDDNCLLCISQSMRHGNADRTGTNYADVKPWQRAWIKSGSV